MNGTATDDSVQDKDLERLALEEIMKETKRGAERAKEHGALGWQKSPIPPANKAFLNNMMKQTIDGNLRKERKDKRRENDLNRTERERNRHSSRYCDKRSYAETKREKHDTKHDSDSPSSSPEREKKSKKRKKEEHSRHKAHRKKSKRSKHKR